MKPRQSWHLTYEARFGTQRRVREDGYKTDFSEEPAVESTDSEIQLLQQGNDEHREPVIVDLAVTKEAPHNKYGFVDSFEDINDQDDIDKIGFEA